MRHQDAADGGALLSRLGGHFAHHLAHEQPEFLVVRRDVGGQNGAVERVGFGVEGYRVGDQSRMGTQQAGGCGRTGEGHHILAVQVIEQVARAADHELLRTVRQQAGVLLEPHAGLGQVRGGGGGLDDRPHAGRQAFAELDARSHREVAALLERLPAAEQERLIGAMRAIEAVLAPLPLPRGEPYVLRSPCAGDIGWVIQRHAACHHRCKTDPLAPR